MLKLTELHPVLLLLKILARTDCKGWCFFFKVGGVGWG